MLKLRIILLSNFLYFSFVILSLIIALINISYFSKTSLYTLADTVVEGYIHALNIEGNHLQLEVRGKEKVLVNYYFKTYQEKKEFNLCLGDYIKAEGTFSLPSENRVFNLFNYRKYLSYNGIFYLVKAKEIIKLKSSNKIRYKFKQGVINRISLLRRSSSYVQTFILGNKKGIDPFVYQSYQENGVSHLFALSGMHVSLLALILLFILKNLKVDEVKSYIITVLFLFCYAFLADFTASIMRATLFFTLLGINRIYYFHIKTLNILGVTFSLLILFNPYFLYDIGFQFSLIISFYLILFQELINKYSSYLGKTLIVSFIAFLASIPITINNFFMINLFTPFYNLIFVPLVSFLVLPISLLTFVFPILDQVLSLIIMMMESISLFINKLSVGTLILSKPSIFILILYYLVITFVLLEFLYNRYYYFLLIVILLFVHTNSNYFKKIPYLVFIDVGQGDSILINLPSNKGTILVDTGGEYKFNFLNWQQKRKPFSLGKDLIIPYLRSEGIKKIDYLVLTHGHIDHLGEALMIINNFPVKTVVLGKSSLTEIEEDLIKELKRIKKPYLFLGADDVLRLKEFTFYVLNPNDDNNPNDDSLVLYFRLNQQSVLLTGDISKSIEYKLINTYNLFNVDILKVGHHGSYTSSSEEFLDILNPLYGVIMVGKNNKFDHPHPQVLKRLEERLVKTFLTSEQGSIKFFLKKEGVTFKTVKPYDILEH